MVQFSMELPQYDAAIGTLRVKKSAFIRGLVKEEYLVIILG